MSDHKITAANIMAAFPESLLQDPNMAALAESIADEFERLPQVVSREMIYSRIDELPEDMLDILAYDFKIDWWDPNYTLKEKRKTLKENWYVHRHMGTRGAVERAISAIYPDTTLEEWFEYDGEPYHFRLWVNLSDDDVDSDRMRRVLSRLEIYKNLRSHNDAVYYFTKLEAEPKVYAHAGFLSFHAGIHVNVESTLKPWPTYKASADSRVGVGRIMGSMRVNIGRS